MEFADVIDRSRIDDVVLRTGNDILPGTLAITSHHLIFQFKDGELWLLHRVVDLCVAVQSGIASSSAPVGPLQISLKCKTFRTITMEFRCAEDSVTVKSVIDKLSNLDDPCLQYPFFWRCSWDPTEDGWKAFSVDDYFCRLRLVSERFRLSRVNESYDVCPSYSKWLIVPVAISDDILRSAASFRQHNRFPVLSYYHKETKSVLLRSSQPLSGQTNRRSREDEQLLNAYLSPVGRGYIIDTRSQIFAQAAKAKGGGTEQSMHYNQWKILHRPILRFNQLAEALSKHVEACLAVDADKFLARLAEAGWMQAVADVLTCAALTAQSLDREVMVTALAQLILDADTRTIRGFESLIEREWLASGHPFFTRCAHCAFARGSGAEGPTFVCFLDCVFQLLQQNAYSFEFTEDFLLSLFEHAYASEYGTFLCDNEKERSALDLSSKTVSLWSFMNRPEILNEFINPFYEPNNGSVWPSVAPQNIVLWDALFLRWTVDLSERKRATQQMRMILVREKAALSQVSKLRREFADLLKEAEECGITYN